MIVSGIKDTNHAMFDYDQDKKKRQIHIWVTSRIVICVGICEIVVFSFVCCGVVCFVFHIDLIFGVYRHFQQYFICIMATSFSGEWSRSTRREPPTMGKQLANFITCGCESGAPFFVIYNALYELLGNPTT